MQAIWKSIEAWLKENAPEMMNDLADGASDKEIQAVEKHIQQQFPDDVKKSYRIHDGKRGDTAPLFGDWDLLSLADIKMQWQILKDLFDKGEFEGAEVETPDSVRKEWWNPSWIPLMYNGAGDYLCLDLAPPAKGKKGQIISYWHVNTKRERYATSFREWLKSFAADLEAGKYRADEGSIVRVGKS